MSYSFSGFFIKNRHIHSNTFRKGHVYREIVGPFLGCGILTPNMRASFPECIKYLNNLGVSGSDWIFMTYETWAGPVDYVMAIGMQAGNEFGPIEADGDPAQQAFFHALDAFGLEEGSGVIFAPFERGFWDND